MTSMPHSRGGECYRCHYKPVLNTRTIFYLMDLPSFSQYPNATPFRCSVFLLQTKLQRISTSESTSVFQAASLEQALHALGKRHPCACPSAFSEQIRLALLGPKRSTPNQPPGKLCQSALSLTLSVLLLLLQKIINAFIK